MATSQLNSPRFAVSGTPVFMYHDICAGTPRDRFAVTKTSFVQQLDSLRERRFCISDISAIDGACAERQVVLTFDDGLASHHEHAFPALMQHGFRATFFVSSTLVGAADYLTWTQIREMSDAGMQFGSHGQVHTDYSLLESSVALHQLRASRQALEDATGKSVAAFSAPYGFLNQRLIENARAAGFQHICSSRPWFAYPHATSISRVAVYSHTSLPEFVALASGAPAPMLRRLLRHVLLFAPKQLLLHTWPQRLGVNVQEVAR